ncbi:hypothetical protein [Bradyrhizobium erythrophlei]|jgi:hypothetical protein|uniref:hypothetical protein n=1 Tax=Bradyrhizobium erythrophlei TaxID=1437360 RepID=UPI0009A8F0E4|nr:hypothetical protein [Bradyrhizobium erythrophlei]
MSHKTAATVAHTIGIDTGKNTLHLIGLDDKEAIVLREKIARGRISWLFENLDAGITRESHHMWLSMSWRLGERTKSHNDRSS